MNEYLVERINPDQRHHYTDLFSQYNQKEIALENMFTNRLAERMFNGEPVLFIVLTNCSEQIPVGFIQLYSVCSPTNVLKTTVVHDLYVLPDYRKNGIALKLIEAAVRFSINNRSALIRLETLRDNLIAQKLFESVGFKSETSESEWNVYSIQFEFD